MRYDDSSKADNMPTDWRGIINICCSMEFMRPGLVGVKGRLWRPRVAP